MRRHALALGAAVLIASCAPASLRSASTVHSAAARDSVPPRALAGEAMRECFVGPAPARCGSLLVAVDPARPADRRITLNVAVVPATSSASTTSALFLLAGGPGGAATVSFTWAVSTFGGLRPTHDLVLVDQRGTGGSDQLRLPPLPDLGAASPDEATRAIEAWAKTGFAALPPDVPFYTSRDAADDIEAVRVALGYGPIDVYGGSYGATVAQYYLRQHPSAVRSMILDGATLLDVPVFERIALNAQRALDLLFERCAADAGCRNAYPALRSEFAAVTARLAMQHATTTVEGEPVEIGRDFFANVVHAGLMGDLASAELPSIIAAAYRDDWRTVASAHFVRTKEDSYELAMSLVIRCGEPWARFDANEVARLAPTSFDTPAQVTTATLQAAACRYVPRAAVVPGDERAVTSDAPVLLLVGGADPQDPVDNVADAKTELPNSSTVVVPGHGHTVASLGCMGAVIVAFIRAGTARALDTSCVRNGGVPLTPFQLP